MKSSELTRSMNKKLSNSNRVSQKDLTSALLNNSASKAEAENKKIPLKSSAKDLHKKDVQADAAFDVQEVIEITDEMGQKENKRKPLNFKAKSFHKKDVQAGAAFDVQEVMELADKMSQNSQDEKVKNILPAEILNKADKSGEVIHNEENGCEKKGNYKNQSHMILVDFLIQEYSFVCIDSLLYYYISDYGYWRIIRSDREMDDLRDIIPDSLDGYATCYNLKEAYLVLRKRATKLKSDDITERDNYFNLIDCAVKIKSGNKSKKTDDRKGLYFIFFLPITYEEFINANTDDRWYKEYLSSLFGSDGKTIAAFETMIGLALSNIRNLKVAFILYGKSDTGKSVVLKLLRRLLPDELVTSVSFSKLNRDFIMSKLVGSVLNVSGEVSGVGDTRIDNFKSLTGDDLVTTEEKSEPAFQFINRALFIFACNSLPGISPNDMEAFLNRVYIIPFTNVFSRQTRNNNVINELLAHRAVIIKAGIKAVGKLKAQEFVFEESIAMQQCRQQFLGDNNSFLLFAKNHIRKKEDCSISSKRLYTAYTQFCNQYDLNAMSQRACAKVMKDSFDESPTHITSGEDILSGYAKYNSRGYKGIELYDTEDFLFSENSFHEGRDVREYDGGWVFKPHNDNDNNEKDDDDYYYEEFD
ncbi:MAG: phage/plasmid primase, P4 family, partial [Clostridiales bacterium]|nr:phage/plasmid primase, P4 family [Clostridiales bacterium]